MARTHSLVAAVILLLGVGEDAAWKPIEATTYEQRQAARHWTEPVREELLMLPFGAMASVTAPHFLAVGVHLDDVSSEPWCVVDRLIPRVPLHDEYLAQRKALASDGIALIDWCLKNHLDACAEFEAARRMHEIDDFTKPEYAPHLRRWLELRDREQLGVSLPLPLEGEWFVLEDKTCHHRLKSFAAYAFDLVRRVDERVCSGKGTALAEYYGFGQPIVAQADGVVVDVDNDFPDNAPGVGGKFDEANCVIVDYGGGVLGGYGHCKQGSAAVKPGDKVVRGTRLASVGNSGASGTPHLHFSMIDWGYDSIRGRFRGESRKGAAWTAFEGQDLVPGTYVRNCAAAPVPAKH
jgi:hypothetical protein